MRKINFCLIFSFLLMNLYVHGKENHISTWEFNPLGFEYDMSIHASLTLNGIDIPDYETFELGAFCQEECRGVAVTQNKNGISYYELRVYSDKQEGEIISFKCVDKTTGKEYAVLQTLTFDGEHHGTLSNLFELNAIIAVEGITLSESIYTLNTEEQVVLVATISPEDAWNTNVIWESEDETIATVDATGVVTALKAGSTRITAVTEEGNFVAICEVTVLQPVKGIFLNEEDVTILTQEEKELVATILPEDASDKSLIWFTSEEEILSIDQKGKITGLKAGEAIVTVTTVDGNFEASCKVTVIQPTTGIVLSEEEITILTNEEKAIIATILPEDASNKDVLWSSSDEDIVTVSQTGIVRGVKAGRAVITATTVDGDFSAGCEITVLQPVTEIMLSETEISLVMGDEYILIATILPEDASNKEVIWKSEDESVAIVNQSGKIEAVNKGNTIVSATTKDGSYRVECKVMVINPVSIVEMQISNWCVIADNHLEISNLPQNTIVRILNVQGEVMAVLKNISQSSVTISCINWNSGIYIIQLQTPTGQVIRKVMR